MLGLATPRRGPTYCRPTMRTLVTALALVASIGAGCRCGSKDKTAAKGSEGGSAAARAPAAPSLQPAEVTGPGLVPAVGLGPRITVSKREIALDGEGLVAI